MIKINNTKNYSKSKNTSNYNKKPKTITSPQWPNKNNHTTNSPPVSKPFLTPSTFKNTFPTKNKSSRISWNTHGRLNSFNKCTNKNDNKLNSWSSKSPTHCLRSQKINNASRSLNSAFLSCRMSKSNCRWQRILKAPQWKKARSSNAQIQLNK